MRSVAGISFTEYPKQSDNVNRRVIVCYNFDPSKSHEGTIIRDDMTEPGKMIIKLDNGRVLLSTECMYHYAKPVTAENSKQG